MGGVRRQLAEQPVERMIGANLIRAPRGLSVRNAMDASAEISKQIEVASFPVNVFEDDGGGRIFRLIAAATREHLMPGSSAGEERLSSPAEVGRHVEQGPEVSV